jgi:hypothetical protein
MNNGLTSVVLSALCLAGSEFAKSESEKRIMIWLSQRDQSTYGFGCVGFDISEMPWIKEDFQNQKDFLVKTIDAALNKKNWHKVDYKPREDWVFEKLQKIKSLILRFDANDISLDENPIYPFHDGIEMFQKCEIHGIYLYSEGCLICNDK